MKIVQPSAAVLTALAIIACQSPGSQPHGSAPSKHLGAGQCNSRNFDARRTSGMSFYNHLSHHSAMYGVRVFHTDSGVEFRGRDRSPGTDEEFTWRVRRDLLYVPSAITSRHGHEFYMGGNLIPTGLVIEKMVMHVPHGAFYTEQGIASTSIGTPTNPIYEQLKLGRPFVEPALRAAPTFTVTTIAPPTDCEAVLALGADPEGRFLLIAGKDDQAGTAIWQRETATGASTRLLDSSSHSFVEHVHGFTFQDSTLEGRIVRVHTETADRPILQDASNDGLFEAVHLITYDEAETKFPSWSITTH